MPNVKRPHVQVALFWVNSQLKASSTATLDQYHHFYNEELVGPVLKSKFPNGPKTIVRWKNETTSSASFAFAATSPMQDVQLVYGPIVDRVMAKTRAVPTIAFDGDTAYQHVDFSNICYRYLYMIESERDSNEDADAYPLTMIADSFNAPDQPLTRIKEEALFKAKYGLPESFQDCEHHWQSLVYKLLIGKAPRYLVLHFFDCEHNKLEEEVLAAEADRRVDRQVYSLLRSQGEMIYPPPPRPSKTESESGDSTTTKKSHDSQSSSDRRHSSSDRRQSASNDRRQSASNDRSQSASSDRRQSSGDRLVKRSPPRSAPSITPTALDWILY